MRRALRRHPDRQRPVRASERNRARRTGAAADHCCAQPYTSSAIAAVWERAYVGTRIRAEHSQDHFGFYLSSIKFGA